VVTPSHGLNGQQPGPVHHEVPESLPT
jgi:hypothetical protein